MGSHSTKRFPNAVAPDYWAPPDHAPNGRPPTILVPRMHVPKNGIEYAAEAMRKIVKATQGATMLITGDGPLRPVLEQKAKEVGQGQIRFLGFVSRERMRELYQQVDVVLIPSVTTSGTQENTSIAALEAMASGKPVIATDIGGLPEVIRDGQDGILIPERNREATEPKADAAPLSDATRKRVLRIAMVLFFLLTAGSLLTLRSDQYGKPASYFVLVAASAGMIALRITLLETTKEVAPTLAMITLVALNFFGSNQLVFPLGIGGADASTHLQFLVNPIVQTGFLPLTDPCGLVYGAFPAHHILVAMTAILTASDPTRTYYSLGALVMTTPVLVAFLIGRSLFGARIGLLAALVLSGSSYFIFWAAHDAPLSFAVPLVGFLLLSFLMMLRGPNVRMIFVAGGFRAPARG